MDNNTRKANNEKISVEATEVITHIVRSRTVSVTLTPPTEWANLIFVATEHKKEENPQEEPTEHADINVKITDMPNPAPSEHAEVKVNLVDGEGNVKVPGRFAGKLLDGCIAVACAVSAGIATKWVLETPNDSLQDWMVLMVVMAQILGIGVLAWRAMRRRQR